MQTPASKAVLACPLIALQAPIPGCVQAPKQKCPPPGAYSTSTDLGEVKAQDQLTCFESILSQGLLHLKYSTASSKFLAGPLT